MADSFTETWQARREWNTFNVLNGKIMKPRIFYPARLTFRTEGKIKSFPEKQKIKESVTIKPSLQKNSKGNRRERTKTAKPGKEEKKIS